MSNLQAALNEANSLSDSELRELVRMLAQRAATVFDEDDERVGQRGLSSWSESTRAEDWSEHYPESLRNGGKNPA